MASVRCGFGALGMLILRAEAGSWLGEMVWEGSVRFLFSVETDEVGWSVGSADISWPCAGGGGSADCCCCLKLNVDWFVLRRCIRFGPRIGVTLRGLSC